MNLKKLFLRMAGARRLQGISITKCCCYFLCIVAAVEFIALNIFALYAMSFLNRVFAVSNSDHSPHLLNRLAESGYLNDLLYNAKSNQLFQWALQETVERIYLVHSEQPRSRAGRPLLRDEQGRSMKDVSFFGLDVSHSKEATYIYNRILTRKTFPYHFLVVDIGANDGFLSSNSFNFIQWGWDAVLVEPQGMELQNAWQNVRSYIDQYLDGSQRVELIRAAITDQDGSVAFHYSRKGQGAMSHVADAGVENHDLDDEVLLHVTSMSVQTLAAKAKVPKNFGVLSVDAEGLSIKIVKQWLTLQFRPAFIILEYLSLEEPEGVLLSLLERHDYRFIGKKGWNYIFEHQPEVIER